MPLKWTNDKEYEITEDEVTDRLKQAHVISGLAQKLAYARDAEARARKEFLECNAFSVEISKQLHEAIVEMESHK